MLPFLAVAAPSLETYVFFLNIRVNDPCIRHLPSMGDGRIFYVGGQSGGKAEGLGGKAKSILLNINRVRKLKY